MAYDISKRDFNWSVNREFYSWFSRALVGDKILVHIQMFINVCEQISETCGWWFSTQRHPIFNWDLLCDRLSLVRRQTCSSLGLSSEISKMHRKHDSGVNIYLNWILKQICERVIRRSIAQVRKHFTLLN